MDNLLLDYHVIPSDGTLQNGHVYYVFLSMKKSAASVSRRLNINSKKVSKLATKIKSKGKRVGQNRETLCTIFSQPFTIQDPVAGTSSALPLPSVSTASTSPSLSTASTSPSAVISSLSTTPAVSISAVMRHSTNQTIQQKFVVYQEMVSKLKKEVAVAKYDARKIRGHYNVSRVNQRDKRQKQQIKKLKTNIRVLKQKDSSNIISHANSKRQKRDIKNYYMRKADMVRQVYEEMVTECEDNDIYIRVGTYNYFRDHLLNCYVIIFVS